MKFISRRLNLRWSIPAPTIKKGIPNPILLRVGDVFTFGIFPVLALVTVSQAVQLLVQPALIVFNTVGLLAYSLILLLSGTLALDRSIQARFNEPTCACFGLTAGLLYWSSIKINLNSTLDGDQGYLPVVIIAAVIFAIATLWKRVLPLGARFFVVSLVANWVLHTLFDSFYRLAAYFKYYQTFMLIIGVLFFTSLIVCIACMIKADTKIQKLWAALIGWICAMAVLSALIL